jgi:hypothetical protein
MQDDSSTALKNHLAPIIMNHRHFVGGDKIIYRIYTSASEFQRIEADSAHEAYTKSGLSRVHKIERDMYTSYLSLSKEQLQPVDKTITTDTNLPTPEERRSLLIAVFGDDGIPTKPPFEEMNIGDLQKRLAALEKEQTQAAKPETQHQEFAAADAVIETTASLTLHSADAISLDVAVETNTLIETASEELTPEEVEALLNAT